MSSVGAATAVGVFHCNTSYPRYNATFQIRATSDDDFLGFVVGFKEGNGGFDNPNTNYSFSDYILFDWKRFSQSWPFVPVFPSSPLDVCYIANSTQFASFGRFLGLKAWRVTGIPSLFTLWTGRNLDPCPGFGDGNKEFIADGITYGSFPWIPNQVYNITVDVTPGTVQVWVNNALEFNLIDLDPLTTLGSTGFYVLSQSVIGTNNMGLSRKCITSETDITGTSITVIVMLSAVLPFAIVSLFCCFAWYWKQDRKQSRIYKIASHNKGLDFSQFQFRGLR